MPSGLSSRRGLRGLRGGELGADSLLGIASDDLGATGGGAAGALDSDGLEEEEEEEGEEEERFVG